jgi:putative FmdB family regulatory protein
MPTYDYVCDACDHKFELFQSMMAPVKRKCPKCGKQKLRRLIGMGAAIMFKGSGFYKTDYRSEGYKKQAAADKPSEPTESKPSGGESKSSAAADSKPSGGSESNAEKRKPRTKK